MAITRSTIIFFTIASLFLVSSAQTCRNYTFSENTIFESCTDLQTLKAHLHWNYNASEKTVEIAYRANQTPKGWIAWGINPIATGMVGTQALVAFQDSQGKMKVYSTQITSYNPSLKPEPLSFRVSKLSAEYLNNEMIIFGVLGPFNNGTGFNIIWQAGNSVSNDIPDPHPFSAPHLQSFRTLDFVSA